MSVSSIAGRNHSVFAYVYVGALYIRSRANITRLYRWVKLKTLEDILSASLRTFIATMFEPNDQNKVSYLNRAIRVASLNLLMIS